GGVGGGAPTDGVLGPPVGGVAAGALSGLVQRLQDVPPGGGMAGGVVGGVAGGRPRRGVVRDGLVGFGSAAGHASSFTGTAAPRLAGGGPRASPEGWRRRCARRAGARRQVGIGVWLGGQRVR